MSHGKIVHVLFQKRVARIILDCEFSVPPFVLFSKLRWMTFPERVTYEKAIQMCKTIHDEAPAYLKTSFTFSSDVNTLLLWSSSTYQLYVPKPNLEIFRHTFFFLAAQFGTLWHMKFKVQHPSNIFKDNIFDWHILHCLWMYIHPYQGPIISNK